MKLGEAVRHALDGNAILFIGSGFSMGAKNISDSEFLSGKRLSIDLCSEIGIDEELGLDVAASIYLEEKGTTNLIDKLRSEFIAKDISDSHIETASIPWRRVYTTNYDNVFELSARKSGFAAMPITLGSKVSQYLDKSNICLHINGYIEHLTSESINSDFKLTTRSYLTDEFNKSKWSTVFRNDIDLAKSVIFIGYSLYDIDIARNIYDIDAIRDKTVFVVGDNPSVAERHTIKPMGRIITGGLNKFVKTLQDIKKNYSPKESDLYLKSFSESEISNTNTTPSDRDRYSLLLYGDVVDNLVFKSIQDKEVNYCVRRSISKRIMEDIASGINNSHVVYGDLGNGKTIITKEISSMAIQRGIRVFVLGENDKYAIEDLSKLIKLREKCILIIENYSRHRQVVEQLSLRELDDVYYIFTERSSLHEYYFDLLLDGFSSQGVIEYDCNKLNESEIIDIERLVSVSGLWGDKASYSPYRRKDYIEKYLNSEFQSLLIDVLESPSIKGKFLNVFEGIRSDETLHKAILLALVLKVLNFEPSITSISEMLGLSTLRKKILDNSEQVGLLFNYSNRNLVIKSSVLAKFYLSKLNVGTDIVEVLKKSYHACEELKDTNPLYKDLRRSLVRFSIIQGLLPDKQRRPLVIEYYEDIKNHRSNIENSLFWLQYGIARLTLKDYEISYSCFDTAYKIAERSTIFNNLHQIDNHYARLLLESSIASPEKHPPMENFRKAHFLLSKQVSGVELQKHYPYTDIGQPPSAEI